MNPAWLLIALLAIAVSAFISGWLGCQKFTAWRRADNKRAMRELNTAFARAQRATERFEHLAGDIQFPGTLNGPDAKIIAAGLKLTPEDFRPV